MAGVSALADEPRLVAHWALDDTEGMTASDTASGECPGFLRGFPENLPQWVPGRLGGALRFNLDGLSNEVVLISDSPALNFTNHPAFSISCWVRPEAPQIPGCGILCKGYGAGGEQYALDTMNGRYRFHVRDAAGQTYDCFIGDIADKRWHQLACVFDGAAGVMAMYYDGQSAGLSKPVPKTLLFTREPVSIGNRRHAAGSGYDLPFKGTIDDVRIYDLALTGAEVEALYTQAGVFSPVFYAMPQNVTEHERGDALFTAEVDGTGPLTLQWQKDGLNLPGKTTSLLKLMNLQGQDAGTYTLQVSDAHRLSASASAVLVVRLFYWHTWGFRVVAALVFIILVILAVHLRERTMAHRAVAEVERRHVLESERMRIARDMHDEIGGKLSRISFLSDIAGRNLPEASTARRQVDEVSAAAQDVIRTVDEIVWAINPRNDTAESLIHYLGRHAQEFFELTEVELELKLPTEWPAHALTAETRHSFYCAVREALNNVLKHSTATKVRMEFSLTSTALSVTIIDNGCGFDPVAANETPPGVNARRQGFGLVNMRERLEGVHGRCEIQSQRGTGTRVTLTINLT